MLGNFTDPLWDHVVMDATQRYEMSLKFLVCAGDSWVRLVFPAMEPKRAIFRLALPVIFVEGRVDEVCTELKQKAERCSSCVDESYTKQILDASTTSLRKAHRLTCGVAQTLNISSAAVEKFHLVAEETKPRRSRGAALSAGKMSSATFQSRSQLMHHESTRASWTSCFWKKV